MTYEQRKAQFFLDIGKTTHILNIENENILYDLIIKLIQANNNTIAEYYDTLKEISIDKTVDDFGRLISLLTLTYISYLYAIKIKNDVLKNDAKSKISIFKKKLLQVIDEDHRLVDYNFI